MVAVYSTSSGLSFASSRISSYLVRENYGEMTLNINPDSIYTGALGAATFAWRAVTEEGKVVEHREAP